VPIGPTNIEGRVTAVAPHPDNASIILAAGESGGIFRTADAGNSWIPVADELPNLAVEDIQFKPGNPSIVFAGAGDDNLYISQDAGTTWTVRAIVRDTACGDGRCDQDNQSGQVDRIRIDPTNPNNMYVVRQSTFSGLGVYKSTDAGLTWSKVLGPNLKDGTASQNDLAMDVKHPQELYAVLSNRGIFKTVDGGANWSQLGPSNGLPQTVAEGAVAVAPTSPGNSRFVYVAIKDSSGTSGFYFSSDGTSWTLQCGSSNQTLCVQDPRGQIFFCCFGDHDGAIVVDPKKEDVVYFTNFNRLYKSTDRGLHLTSIPQHHDDQQSFAIQLLEPATNRMLWAGNDGGLEKVLLVNPDSMPAQSDWMEINRLPVTQFYDLAVAPRNPNLVFGATQDNGVSRYGGTLNWDNLGRCGDATGVVIDPVIPSIVYARCWNGFDESLDGGNTWRWASSGLDQTDLQWKAQTGVFPRAANTLYAGGQRVYKSHREPSGLTWTPISGSLQPPYQLTAVASSWTNENRVYAAFGWPGSGYGAYMFRTLDGGATPWLSITSPDPGEFISSIAVDPADDRILYVTTGALSAAWKPRVHLWKTNDATAQVVAWSSVGSCGVCVGRFLPDARYNDIAISPINHNRVVVVHDVVNGVGGVYETLDGGASWAPAGDLSTLPNTSISGVALECGVDITVSTYGRSMWRLPSSNPDVDTDGDGFSDCAEQYMVTNVPLACPVTSVADDEAIDAWPPDFNDDTFVDITDVNRMAAQRFGAMRGDPDYNPRYDLNADGFIDITDMSTVQSRFGQTCR